MAKTIKGISTMEAIIIILAVIVIAGLFAAFYFGTAGAATTQMRANVNVQASTTGFLVNVEVLSGQMSGAPSVRYAPVGSTSYQTATCTLLTGVAAPRAGQSASYLCSATLSGGTRYDVIVALPGAGGRGTSVKMTVQVPVS